MVRFVRKGQRRLDADQLRRVEGEPKLSLERGSKLNSRYPKGGKAHRNKGRNRFKTGRKQR